MIISKITEKDTIKVENRYIKGSLTFPRILAYFYDFSVTRISRMHTDIQFDTEDKTHIIFS